MENLPELDRFDNIRRLVEVAYEDEQKLYPAPVTLVTPSASAPLSLAVGPSSQDILDALRDNEDGDARLFISLNKGKILFDHSNEEWYRWTGNYWQADKVGNFYPSLDVVIQNYSDEAQRQAQARTNATVNQNAQAAEKAKRLENDLLKRVFNLQTLYRKRNVLFLAAQGSSSLAISGEEWDRDPWVLGCTNGVIDLKTGTFRPGKPEDFIKSVAPCEWKGLKEPAPIWEKFLGEIFNGDKELVAYIQRLMGYSITGLTVEHVLPILWGEMGRRTKWKRDFA